MRTCWLLISLVACGDEAAVCGDGEVGDNEQCDDGNHVLGDGCTACLLDAPSVCGDGVTASGEACDDGNLTDGDGCTAECLIEATLGMRWSFEDVATSQTTGCPVGFDTVRIVTTHVDENLVAVGEPAIDLFPCADGIAIIPFLPAQYVTFLEVTNVDGTQVYAQSLRYLVDLAAFSGTIPITIVNDGGYFGVNWKLRGASSNSALTCAQAGVDVVSVTVASSSTATEERFDCTRQGALTEPLRAGSYTVSVSALNGTQQGIGTAPPLVESVIQAPNKVTALGEVTIPITGL